MDPTSDLLGGGTTCPICNNYNGDDSLEVHLLTHSKESLILTLLQLKKNKRSSSGGRLESETEEIVDVILTRTRSSSSEEGRETTSTTEIKVQVEELEDSADIEFISEEIEINLTTNISASCESSGNNNNSNKKLEREEEPIREDDSRCLEDDNNCSRRRICDQGEVVQQVGEKVQKRGKEPEVISVTPAEPSFSGTSKESGGGGGGESATKNNKKKVDVFIVSATRSENKLVIEGIDSPSELHENVCNMLEAENFASKDVRRGDNRISVTQFPDTPHTSKAWSMEQIYPDDINLSTAIKYIIDESDNRTNSINKEKNLIYLDGRYIPVYSSITELHCSDDFNPPSPDLVVGKSKAGGLLVESDCSNLDVDLMTDEEIPPKGEISEFEESNTSLMSEDSNLKLTLMDSSRNKSSSGRFPSIHLSMSFEEPGEDPLLVGNVLKVSPEIAVTSVGSSKSKGEEFICFDECQTHKSPKQFSSLFEMIQHKSGEHASTSKKVDPTVPVITISEEILPPSEDVLRETLETTAAAFDPDRIIVEPVHQQPSSILQRKKYFCLYCDFTSPVKSVVANHNKDEHPDRASNPEMFECSTCGKIFNNRPSLRKHLLVHREKPFVCSICSKGFPSKYKLMEHTRVHTGYYPYKCSVCGKAYRTPSLLSTHEKRAHPETESEKKAPKKVELMCGICHRIIHSKRNMESHLLLHKQKPQKCPHCSETFPRPSVLVRHIRALHDPLHSAPKVKDCAICGKFYHPNSMKSHMLIHKKEKPHKCLVCHKNFRTLGNLNNHSWSHTSAERPYKCQICPKSYIFQKNLQNHTIVHKRKTLHYVCNECGVKFTNKFNLKRHVEEHTAEKKYKCLICGKKFFRHYYLVDHVRIHSGSRPYTCTICGKASSTKSNHVAHVKIHDARESGNLEG